jgi:hypothetical protein
VASEERPATGETEIPSGNAPDELYELLKELREVMVSTAAARSSPDQLVEELEKILASWEPRGPLLEAEVGAGMVYRAGGFPFPPDNPAVKFPLEAWLITLHESTHLLEELIKQGEEIIRGSKVSPAIPQRLGRMIRFKAFKELQPSPTSSSPPGVEIFPGLDVLIARATEVFANEEKALRWLGTPVRALNYATPISLLGQPEGQNAVLAVLNKIEHGVL